MFDEISNSKSNEVVVSENEKGRSRGNTMSKTNHQGIVYTSGLMSILTLSISEEFAHST